MADAPVSKTLSAGAVYPGGIAHAALRDRNSSLEIGMADANRPADWKHFDDFAAGIATNRLPTTDALSGTALKISLKNGRAIELTFNATDEVAWREGGERGIDWYEAINVAPNVVFINMTFSARPDGDEAFIVNVRTRRVLSIRERVRSADEALGEPRVSQDYTPGSSAIPPFQPKASSRHRRGS